MDKRQLEIFTELAENLSFKKTADRLYLSQTTITVQIKNLEEELGVRLFERTTRTVALTPAGKVFKDYAESILSLANNAINETIAAASDYTGFLNIAFCIDTNKAGLSELIRDFMKDNPKTRINIQGGYPEQLLHSLNTDDCSLLITPYFRELDLQGLKYYKLGRFKSIVAFNRNHYFNTKEVLHFSDFEGESLIRVAGKAAELEFSAEFLTKLRRKNISTGIYASTDDIDAVLLMLEANLGVAVIPEYFEERLSGNPLLATRRIDENLRGTSLVAAWRAENKSEELKNFIAFLKKRF